MQALLALWSYFLLGWLLLFWLPLMLVLSAVTFPFDPTRRLVGRSLRVCGVLATKFCPMWKMEIRGVRPEHAKTTYVVVANHESIVDIFLLAHLPWEMKWIAKEVIFRIPWLGWMFRMAGDIPVLRGDHTSGAAALEKAAWYLRRGMSVMIFPEGTRTRDGNLLPFKPGAFRLAIETGVPILPIVVHGSGAALPVKSPWIRKASCVAQVLDPVPVTGLGPEDAERLSAEVRSRIAAGLQALKGTSPNGA